MNDKNSPPKTNNPDPPPERETTDLASRAPSQEEKYYLELAYKEPVESLARIEDTAKLLVGAVSGTSGLFLAAIRFMAGGAVPSGHWGYLPFIFWGVSIVALILVLLPLPYYPGIREPASWKKELLKARKYKYRRLVFGAGAFVLGVFAGFFAWIPK